MKITQEVITIICAVLGATGLWQFLISLVQNSGAHKQKKVEAKEKEERSQKRLECIERDCNRM